jgi:hypothetical protein
VANPLKTLLASPRRTAQQNPRKPAQGTAYSSTTNALIAPPQNNDTEYGSSQPVIIREIVPELISPIQRLTAYSRMMKDAGVNSSIRAAKMPVLGAEFYVDAYSDNPNDQMISEFIYSNLMEGMSSPFLNSLEDILHMYEDGYAVCEKVHELREWTPKRTGANNKEYTMLKKLGIRPTSTIKEIKYDNNGGPQTVSQSAIQADGTVKDVDLDVSNIVIFTFNKNAGDLTGNSLLRTAYQHWFYKTHFYKIDAIQKERHSLGIPKGKLLAGFKDADKKALRKLLANLRSNEEAFMMLPPNVDVEFAEIKGNLVNVLESAVHHNSMILLNVLAQFLALGLENSGGGRATAGAQTDIFMKSLRYVAQLIADIINMYVIPELVVWNFPTTNFPQLKVRNIGETRDLQMLASGLSNLVAQGVITMDEPTEAWARRTFDMPNSDPTTRRAPVNATADTPVAGVSTGPQKGSTKNGKATGNVGANPTSAN